MWWPCHRKTCSLTAVPHIILTPRNFLSEMHLRYEPHGLIENPGQFHESAGQFHPQIWSTSEVASLE